MLPQPPANSVPAPPPVREVEHCKAKRNLILLLGIVSILFCGLWALRMLVVLPAVKNYAHTEAFNNLRQIGMMLAEFDSEYGRFPDASTIPAVKAASGTPLTLNDHSSNMLFRQLMVSGVLSEKPFWAKTSFTLKTYDDVHSTDATMLAPGEMAFAYIPGHSAKSHPETPVVMAPLLAGKRTFERKSFQGRAVVLFADSSVRVLPIDKHGRAILKGMDLFDPRQPFWGGKAPDIKWAE